MKQKIKTILALSVLVICVVVGYGLILADRPTDVYPQEDTLIRLYGEAHGSKVYYDIEFDLWKGYYEEGYRNLFLELPYYSAEFLNLWMQAADDEIIDTFFEEIQGTQSGNRDYYEFFHEIKESCPETRFYGTDVGHQYNVTGARYLAYLEENGLQDSEDYMLAKENIRQGEEFYAEHSSNGISPIREGYMISNFKDAYTRCGGRIMGIYGSYHTELGEPERMAANLKDHYGDVISCVKVSSLAFGEKRSPYRLGFSVTGFLFLLMLFVPNGIWAGSRKPAGYDEASGRENKVLLMMERVGEVVVSTALLIFPAVNPYLKKLPEGVFFEWNMIFWIMALVLMIFYECYWIRYFRSQRTLGDFYASFAGFPVAGATLPVLTVLLMGMYAENLILVGAAIILGIGHIGIHVMHRKELS